MSSRYRVAAAPAGRRRISAAVLLPVLCLLGVACSLGPSSSAVAQPVAQEDRINTRVFRCVYSGGRSSFEFTIRLGPGELALWLPLEFGYPYLVLAQDFERGESTYREGGVELTLDRNEAQLDVDGARFAGCSLDPVRSDWEHAKLSGADFRATGADPGWSLELRAGGMLVFRTDDGGIRIAVPTPELDTDPQARVSIYRARAAQQELTVTITDEQCAPADGTTMSGAHVTVTLGGRTFLGCGRPLH